MTILADSRDAIQRQLGVLAQVTTKPLGVLPARMLPVPGDTGLVKPPGHLGQYAQLQVEDRAFLQSLIETHMSLPAATRPTLTLYLLDVLAEHRQHWKQGSHVVVELIRWVIHAGIFPEWWAVRHELPEYRAVYQGNSSPLAWLRPRRPEAILPGEWDENLDGEHCHGYLGEMRGIRAALVHAEITKDSPRTYLDLDAVLPDGTLVWTRLPLTLKTHQAKKGRKRGRYVMVDSRHFPKWLLAELKPYMHIPGRKCRDRRVYLHRVLAALWFARNLNPYGKFKPLQVHHLNELVKDNRIFNLLPLTEAEHALFHDDFRERMGAYNDLGVVGTAEEDWAENSAETWGENANWDELLRVLAEVGAAA